MAHKCSILSHPSVCILVTAAAKDLLMPSLEPVRPSTLEWALEHLNVLTNMVRVLLDADRISVFLYNEESNELCALLNTRYVKSFLCMFVCVAFACMCACAMRVLDSDRISYLYNEESKELCSLLNTKYVQVFDRACVRACVYALLRSN